MIVSTVAWISNCILTGAVMTWDLAWHRAPSTKYNGICNLDFRTLQKKAPRLWPHTF